MSQPAFIRLFFTEDFHTGHTKIFATDANNRDKYYFHKDGEIVEYTRPKAFVVDDNIKPLLELPPFMAEEFIRQVVEFAANKGIKVDKDYTKGELDATKKHLEVMQKINFKLLNIK